MQSHSEHTLVCSLATRLRVTSGIYLLLGASGAGARQDSNTDWCISRHPRALGVESKAENYRFVRLGLVCLPCCHPSHPPSVSPCLPGAGLTHGREQARTAASVEASAGQRHLSGS